MGILIVRLKVIEYKEDSFCYLSSYSPDLGLQAACLLTLSFRPYAFKTFVSSAKRICSPKPFRILYLFYNLNPHLLSSSLTPKKTNFSCSKWVDRTPGSCTHCIQRTVSPSTCMVVPKP